MIRQKQELSQPFFGRKKVLASFGFIIKAMKGDAAKIIGRLEYEVMLVEESFFWRNNIVKTKESEDMETLYGIKKAIHEAIERIKSGEAPTIKELVERMVFIKKNTNDQYREGFERLGMADGYSKIMKVFGEFAPKNKNELAEAIEAAAIEIKGKDQSNESIACYVTMMSEAAKIRERQVEGKPQQTMKEYENNVKEILDERYFYYSKQKENVIGEPTLSRDDYAKMYGGAERGFKLVENIKKEYDKKEIAKSEAENCVETRERRPC
jgi:hypothetical protein